MTAHKLDRLAALLEERLGMSCADWQRERLAEALAGKQRGLARALGVGGEALTEALDGADLALSHAELQALIDAVSIGETYFFREPAQLAALIELAIPERLRCAEVGRPLRILSAGCSSGEEPYSLAITLAEQRPDLGPERVSIVGIDVSAATVARARRARYSRWALRATPPELRERFFRREGEDFRLIDSIRAAVHFEEGNLIEPDPMLLPPGSLDVVFCRNVLIYFSERMMRRAVAELARLLMPGGFLFLGHSETLRGISSEFAQEHNFGTFFYRRTGAGSPGPSRKSPAPPPSPPPPPPGDVRSESGEWFESIQRSAERIAQLTSAAPARPAAEGRPESEVASGTAERGFASFMPVLRLLAAEQQDEALQLLAQLPGSAGSATATLISAAIFYSQSRLDKVKQASQRLLDAGSHTAEARYLLGLCHEHAGERARALRQIEEAVRADPGFAMAQLRLGTLLRRSGQRTAALAALTKALEVLGRERDERILLFGGGFRREALLSLCRSELSALGVLL